MMKVAIASVEQTVLQEDVLVVGPITLVTLTATIQTMIVLIIDTFYCHTFNEYCYIISFVIIYC